MKTFDNDNEFRKLIKELKPESPELGFTQKVMARVLEEKVLPEKVEKERILGKGFWIIVSLFAALFVGFLVMSNAGVQGVSQGSNIFKGLEGEGILKGYQSLFSNLGGLPLSIGGILFASSLLIFADRLFSGLHIGVLEKSA